MNLQANDRWPAIEVELIERSRRRHGTWCLRLDPERPWRVISLIALIVIRAWSHHADDCWVNVSLRQFVVRRQAHGKADETQLRRPALIPEHMFECNRLPQV